MAIRCPRMRMAIRMAINQPSKKAWKTIKSRGKVNLKIILSCNPVSLIRVHSVWCDVNKRSVILAW